MEHVGFTTSVKGHEVTSQGFMTVELSVPGPVFYGHATPNHFERRVSMGIYRRIGILIFMLQDRRSKSARAPNEQVKVKH
jgi:hypothetical protein